MNDLKPGTRSLLATARGAESLSQHDRARLKQRVLMQVAVLGTSAAVTGGAAAMSVAAKITLVVSSVVVLGGGAASVWVWQRPAPGHIEAARRPSVHVKSARVEPAASPAAQAPAPALPAPVRRDSARIPPRRPSPVLEPAAEATGTVAPLDPELRVLRQAQDDLRAGLPAQALRRLQDFERRFGAGSLGQERQAIAAIALCQAQLGPAARARAEAFLRSAPQSPLAARVRAACEGAAVPGNSTNKNDGAREP
jgi:hypothetical protein